MKLIFAMLLVCVWACGETSNTKTEKCIPSDWTGVMDRLNDTIPNTCTTTPWDGTPYECPVGNQYTLTEDCAVWCHGGSSVFFSTHFHIDTVQFTSTGFVAEEETDAYDDAITTPITCETMP